MNSVKLLICQWQINNLTRFVHWWQIATNVQNVVYSLIKKALRELEKLR